MHVARDFPHASRLKAFSLKTLTLLLNATRVEEEMLTNCPDGSYVASQMCDLLSKLAR